jgi:hypothetical protein
MFLCNFFLQQAVKKDSGGGCGRLDGISDDTDFELWDSRFMLRGDHEPEIGYKHARYASVPDLMEPSPILWHS